MWFIPPRELNCSVMRVVFTFFAVLLLATGCVSKSEARRMQQEAFAAGQQQAAAAAANRTQPATVTVQGDVKNESIPWTRDLTLAQAIVSAEYQGMSDPSRIVIIRQGQSIPINPRDLLHGKDVPLEPGDVIDLQR